GPSWKRKGDVEFDESESRVVQQGCHVGDAPGHQTVHTGHSVSGTQKTLADMGSDESRAADHQYVFAFTPSDHAGSITLPVRCETLRRRVLGPTCACW